MKGFDKMKKEKNAKQHKNTDKGAVFVKIMAGVLAVLMIAGTAITLVYAIIGG